MKNSARLQTNLVGKKVHLLTDEEAKEEARKQGMVPAEVEQVDAAHWWPALASPRYKSYRGMTGEIVQVHMDKNNQPVYTINFNGTLEEIPKDLFRIE